MGARERNKARARNHRNESGKSTPASTNSQKHGRHGLTPRSSAQDWQSFASTPYSSSPRNAFSLADEARNTDRYNSGWGNVRLRGNAVAFVSAGNLVREEPQSSSQDDEVQRRGQSPVESHDDPKPVLALGQSPSVPEIREAWPETINTAVPAPSTPKDDGSASSEDEVVFVGRKASDKKDNTPLPAVDALSVEQPIPRPIPLSPKVLRDPPISRSSDGSPALEGKTTSQRPRRRWESRWEQRRREQEEEEEAIMQDYIANMAMDDDDDDDEAEEHNGKTATGNTSKPQRRNEHFRLHKGDGSANSKVQLRSAHRQKVKAVQVEVDGWDSADLDDFNDLSTTDEDVPEVGRVLRHRERPQGKQYLITAVGMEVSDSKWVPHSKLTSSTAIEQIQVYEVNLESQVQSSAEESSEEDEDLEDLIDEIGSEQDENNRIVDRISRMTDEQIAVALAKQEELGMGGDELLLFNGQDMDDLDDENDMTLDEFMGGEDFIPFSLSQHTSNRGRSKRNRRGRDSFPSAGAFADALDQDPYGGFDVMDFDRPSLRPRRKGRKSDFPFDLEDLDEELAHQLMTTWTKDREKKAARKREKMEEHQSLLLEAAEGSDPAVIKARIRQFLVSEADTLELTPMESHVRASVHRLAKSLKLNSRSQGKDGKGVGRFPVLTKTPYTPHYTFDNIWEVDALMNLRKYFPKQSFKGSKSLRSGPPVSRRDRGGVAAASYSNGEIIGAAAPEIGVENRGRAMLEKMGWSAGQGIGAVGNKGSLDAIRQIVKTNKAGLG